VSVVAVEYHGFNRLPAGSKAQVRAEIFVAGGRGPILAQAFNGPRSGRFALAKTLAAATWSACGADAILLTNTSLRVSTTGNRLAASSLRFQDVKTALVYRLRWRNC
jgi:hypothetical protein